jgi:hypothetical protein
MNVFVLFLSFLIITTDEKQQENAIFYADLLEQENLEILIFCT